MKSLKIIAFWPVIFVAPTALNAQESCNLPDTRMFNARSGDVELHASVAEEHPAFLYTTKMGVNTDGTAKSYHPDDPMAESIAYNNIGNAIKRAWNAEGNRINCDYDPDRKRYDARLRKGACYMEYIHAFEGARDYNYDPRKYPKVEFGDILSKNDRLGWRAPCTNQSKEAKGFFISQTALAMDKLADDCDPDKWVDSMTVNGVVYPEGANLAAQGVVTDIGDLVVLHDRETDHLSYAVHGDIGPEDDIGEGTIALAAELGGNPVDPDATYSSIKRLQRPAVDYLVFPADDVVREYGPKHRVGQADIESFGREVFESWGGIERLRACIAEFG